MTTRRNLIKLIATTPLFAGLTPYLLATEKSPIIQRKIPSSGELLPAVGMGSYQTFNVSENNGIKANLKAVLEAFFSAGGRLIDSSPMYGLSEQVIGELLAQIEPEPDVFAASKVWTYGKEAGENSIMHSEKLMGSSPMDLMQVHNLRDWQVHLETLNLMKANGQLRYTGITTSRISQYGEFAAVMENHALDFIQVNYNIKVRDAEKKLLPMALDKGIGVIVNMPFEKGRLFKLANKQALPEWAAEFDCVSWGQFFLKYIISHPAVTCVIPATSKVHHMQDNMQAMTGRLPDNSMRKKMHDFFDKI
jgi:diketogulonate reductase-like aldo/keto reductase